MSRFPLAGPQRALTLLLLLLPGVAAGCVERATFSVGDTCELSSQCDTSLVCRLGRCRIECADSRDCAAGLVCLPDPQTMLGGCQVDDEAVCANTSDCASPLVCRFETCTTECVGDEDCVQGAVCEAVDAGSVCHEEAKQLCIYNSDCPPGMVCGAGQICYLECHEDRDCVAPRTCDLASNRCVWAGDAGTP